MLVLHHGGSSVASAKVRLVLAEKALVFESRLYDLRRGGHRNPGYLSINPDGVVPTLVHGGLVVRESNVILEYLEDAFPEPPMMPTSAAARSSVRLILHEVNDLHDSCSILSSSVKLAALRTSEKQDWQIFLSRVADSDKRNRQHQLLELGFGAPAVAAALRKYRRVVQLLGATLRNQAWLSGAQAGLADCAALPYFHRVQSLGLAHLWALYPLISDWLERMWERQSFESAIIRWLGTESPYQPSSELQKLVRET